MRRRYNNGDEIVASVTVEDEHGEALSLEVKITLSQPTGNVVRRRLRPAWHPASPWDPLAWLRRSHG